MAWVTKDSTETYNQTPEPPREYTKKEKAANWWHYHWMAVVVAVLVVVFGVWIIKTPFFRRAPTCRSLMSHQRPAHRHRHRAAGRADAVLLRPERRRQGRCAGGQLHR